MCSFASFSHWCFFYPFNTRKDQSHPTSSDGFEGERKVHDGHFSPEPTLEQRIKTEMNWGSFYIGELLFHRLKFLGHVNNVAHRPLFKPVQWIHVCNNDNFALLELTLIFYFPLNRWNYLLADHPWVFLHRHHLVKVSVWFFVSKFIKVLSGPHCFSPSSKGSTGIHPSNRFSSADYFCVLHVV